MKKQRKLPYFALLAILLASAMLVSGSQALLHSRLSSALRLLYLSEEPSVFCQPGCVTCSQNDTTLCFSCQPGFYQILNNCTQLCPVGFYENQEWESCEPCHKGCTSGACDGPAWDQCNWPDGGGGGQIDNIWTDPAAGSGGPFPGLGLYPTQSYAHDFAHWNPMDRKELPDAVQTLQAKGATLSYPLGGAKIELLPSDGPSKTEKQDFETKEQRLQQLKALLKKKESELS